MATKKLTPALIGGLALLSASGALATDMYLPSLPLLEQEFGATPSSVQFTLAAFMVGMGLGQLFTGGLSDILGRKKLLIVGAIAALVASIVCALAPSLIILIVARLAQGLGSGMCVVIARSIIPDLSHGIEAAKAFTLMMVIQGIAPVIAPVLGAFLDIKFGWRSVFWTLAAICFVQLLVVLFQIGETRPVEERGDASFKEVLHGYAVVLKSKTFVGFAVTFVFGFGAMFSYISASPFVVQGQLHFTTTQYSIIFAINAVGMMIMGGVNNRLMDRHAPQQILRVALRVIALGIVILLASSLFYPTSWIILPALFMTIAPMSIVLGNATALATDTVRKNAGAGSAILGAAQFLLAGFVSPLVGIGANHAASMATCMAVSFAIALCGFRFAMKNLKA